MLKYSGFVLLFFYVGCAEPAVSRSPEVFDQPPAPAQSETKDEPKQISDAYVRTDVLSEGAYAVVKLRKNVKLDETADVTEVSYAVLKRNDKILAEFDGVYFGAGNATDFGLFSFLGGNERQLIVSQTIPRGGRHWIVELSPDFRIIYDSADYRVGREDLSVIDIDQDGRFELLQEDPAFYGFDGFSSAETPLPTVIFSYDERARKYLPANHLFKDYALRNVDAEITKLASENDRRLSVLLEITLRCIYAGEEKKAWAFFESEYRRPDKKAVKSKVAAILRRNAVYEFIYRKSGNLDG